MDPIGVAGWALWEEARKERKGGVRKQSQRHLVGCEVLSSVMLVCPSLDGLNIILTFIIHQ